MSDNKNIINCVIDLSNMLFRSIFVLGLGSGKPLTFNSQEELDQLVRKLSTDISYILRIINPTRVILAMDESSWRKGIAIEENNGYKGNRTKNDSINWDNIYALIDEFAELMKKSGLISTKIKGAEGDDICALWTFELLYNNHQHVVLVTGDEDIRQLVRAHAYDIGKYNFVTVYNPFAQGKGGTRKLFIPDHFMDWIEEDEAEIDIWNFSTAVDPIKEDFKKIMTSDKLKVEYVDGAEIALRKVFCGDSGDNIPSIYTWLKDSPDGKEPKECRITHSPYEKIINKIKKNPAENITCDVLLNRSKEILNEMMVFSKEKPAFNIEKRIQRQISLVVLDPAQFPESIVDKFNIIKGIEMAKPRVNVNDINMHKLLANTKYHDAVLKKQKATEMDMFKAHDKVTRSLF